MKKDHVPPPGVVRPKFKPITRPNNKVDRLEQCNKLWRKIKTRLPSICEKDDIYLKLQNKVIKYQKGKKSITQLGFDAAILMRGHPDLLHEFDQLIPETLQDSCTLLSQHLAVATYLEKPNLHNEGYHKVSIHSEPKKRSTRCTIPKNLWKKIKDRFLVNYDSLQDKVDKYKDGRKSITQLSSDVVTLLRGHPDLINEFRKWIPIMPNKGSDEVSSDTSDSDSDSDIYSDSDSDIYSSDSDSDMD
ncbi:uncharacterized protein DS421_16g563410 [Arachis hypogaea]|nr:uncharacterized protein DS421_16g563410 [Arachis hypogaea]